MNAFGHPDFDGHERVVFAHDPRTGLRAIVAIHNSLRGPALGGCRVRQYESAEAALGDVLRLSRDMSRKTAMADLPLGGGRAVVLADSVQALSAEALSSLAAAINELEGRYVAAEDLGMDQQGLSTLAEHSRYVTGAPGAHGRSGGELSPYTALSVMASIERSVEKLMPQQSMQGLRVAIQGLGRVGMRLAELLHAAGAELLVADPDSGRCAAAAERFSAQVVAPDDLMAQHVAVFAPCALGGSIHDDSVHRLRCQIIAGAANNQVTSQHVAYALHARQIFHVPDYIANAGGVIRAGLDYLGGYSEDEIRARCLGITTVLDQVIDEAQRKIVPSFRVAEDICYRKLRRPAE